MTSRATGASLDALPASASRSDIRPRPLRRYSALERGLFVAALVVFSIATTYSSLVMLARVWPALFPGQTLAGAIPGLGSVGQSIGIKDGGAESVYNKRINLLILGLDKRPYGSLDSEPYLTDSIMVTTIDPVTKKASALSFPRDTVIGIHDGEDGQCVERYRDRINTSYGVGWMAGDNTVKAGVEQFIRDLNCEFGIEIDHYVVMDFVGVEEMVDAVGGVEVDISEELAVYDWWYSDEGDRPARYVTYPAGLNQLDGYNAVAFGRFRNDSDLKRAKRQQLVLQAALSKVLQLGWLDSPSQINALWDTYTKVVRTDVPLGRAPGYGLLLKQSGGRIATYSIGDPNPIDGSPTLTPYTGPSGAALLAYDPDNVQFWLNEVFTKAKYADSFVLVQDGRGDDENGELWTAAAGRFLRAKGLPRVFRGDDVPVQAHTEIILLDPERREMAEDIADWLNLPLTAIIEQPGDPSNTTQPEILVTIGTDFELPEN